ncbi:hypothetical protein [Nocardia africana]|uniref:Uncharacterized protein n=1 Tax=Nocardia africana TaxID=134964 RepID=A0A378WXY0_9NOCA|nr:hypothetical protein [Nocardia africana]MCC3313054.1 hypothetical protein [Nocardia africana]SUA45597.1 Uncharacterised protein [Nocardia africana]
MLSDVHLPGDLTVHVTVRTGEAVFDTSFCLEMKHPPVPAPINVEITSRAVKENNVVAPPSTMPVRFTKK